MNRLHQLALTGSLAIVSSTGVANAQSAPPPAPPPAPPAASPQPVASAGAGVVKIGASGLLGIPLGDFGDVFDLGVGALVSVNYGVNSQVELTGRAGLIYFLVDSDLDPDGELTFYDIPIWFGARFSIDPSGQGLYLHGELAVNSYHASFGDQSNTENEVGANFLAGAKTGNLILEGGLYIGSFDESDTKMLGATVGTTF